MGTSRGSFLYRSGIIALLAGCAGAGGPTIPEFTAADSAAVSATAEKWRTSILTRDFTAWATTVASDVVLQPPSIAPIVGREAAVEYIRAYPVITAFQVTITEISGRGDLAYDRGTYALALTLPDGSPAADTGTFLSVFRRQADSTWAHSRVTWNSSRPLPAPPPAPARR